MSELEEARARLKAIAEGRRVPQGISIEEAKQRLRAADPAIDISDLLQALHRGENLQKAAAAVMVETLSDPEVVHYWSPILARLVQALLPATARASSKETADKRGRA